jgi:heptosyltransferase II
MRILVTRYRFIGDTVLMIAFLRNLRRAYPDAVIDVLVGPVSGEVLADCPYINELIVFDTTRKHKYENTKQEKKSFFSYVKLLKSRKYDKTYVLKRSLSSAILMFLAGIPQRIGFNTEGRGIFLTKRVPYVNDRHEVECFLDVLRADGVEVKDNHLENWVSQSSNDKIDGMFKGLNITDNLKVLIHATSGNVNKQWSPGYFAEVINYLSNELGARVFYTGTQKDSAVYDGIRALIGENLAKEPVNLCGKLSIADSTALISRMNMAVGCDSGTLHIAASLNVPVIGIYGPMNHVKWRAWGDIHEALHLNLPCIPCELKKKCPRDIACLKELKPEMVIEKINTIAGIIVPDRANTGAAG